MTPDTEHAAAAARGPSTRLPDTRRFRFRLAGIAAAAYFMLIGAMAFRPGWLGAGREGPMVFAGMLASLLLILLIFVVTGLFVRRITRLPASAAADGRAAHGE